MCWFIDVEVVPQKSTLLDRIVIPNTLGPDRLHGSSPSFSYYDEHCACETVKRKRVGGLAVVVDAFCDQSAVKRVEIRKYWASAKDTQPREIPVTQSEFREICSASGPEENVRYRISPDRFHQS